MAGILNVIVADDHPLIRKGLLDVLSSATGIVVAGQAADGREALTLIESLRPEVVVLDIEMPRRTGLEVVREMRRLKLPGEVVILTVHDRREYLEEALSLGVKGYVLKDAILREIVVAIYQVARGQHYISSKMSAYLLDRDRPGGPDAAPPVDSDLAALSPAEYRVLRLVAEYRTSKEIAEELHVSVRTVETHRANIATKLDLKGAHALIRFALENRDRLVDEPPGS
jgi:DNA-binding NarL/FixJ family response regulator